MVVDGNPELRTAGERWNAGHKGWQSVIVAKKDVPGRPQVVAANEASHLGGGGGNICCLQQLSAASGVRSGGARWGG